MTDAPRAGARRIFMVGKVIAGEFENQAIVIKGGKVVISKGFGGACRARARLRQERAA